MEAHLRALGTGPLHSFATWQRDARVPDKAAGVYTIWWHAAHPPAHVDPTQPVYVGHAGLGKPGKRRAGLWSRLHAHALGRRSGDQFAIYVADRFVLPTMSAEDIQAVAAGDRRIDALVRRYVSEHFAFRWVEMPDAKTARDLEAVLRRGQWAHGKPFLNPL